MNLNTINENKRIKAEIADLRAKLDGAGHALQRMTELAKQTEAKRDELGKLLNEALVEIQTLAPKLRTAEAIVKKVREADVRFSLAVIDGWALICGIRVNGEWLENTAENLERPFPAVVAKLTEANVDNPTP